ncbi:hypothetical protein SNL152K_337 [Streptomyces sp. NL15-2K]|nr:hypothetical protein SNL152K_337 [Streptomyces sp. NL15-2K]
MDRMGRGVPGLPGTGAFRLRTAEEKVTTAGRPDAVGM